MLLVIDTEHAGRDQRRAGQVHLRPAQRGVAGQQDCRARSGQAGEEQVHVQAPPPGQVLGQHAAQQQPHRAARPGDSAVHAERPAALGRIAERHGQQRQRRRREQGAERALAGPRRHQHAEVLRADGSAMFMIVASGRSSAGERDDPQDQPSPGVWRPVPSGPPGACPTCPPSGICPCPSLIRS